MVCGSPPRDEGGLEPVSSVLLGQTRDGRWVAGWVAAQRRDPDGWWALVRYSVSVGMQYRHWRPASELRRGATADQVAPVDSVVLSLNRPLGS